MKKMLIWEKKMERIAEIQLAAPGWEIATADNFEEAHAALDGTEIVVTWSDDLVKACLARDNVKWIQFLAAGVDALPLKELKEKKITLTNASGVHGQPITQTLFAMMLAFARGLNTAMRDQARAEWSQGRHQLSEINGKTIGILGVGAIGLQTARIAKAFDMRVLGLRRGGASAENVDQMYAPDEIDTLLAQSDYVINLLPLTASTRRIMNADRFARMKPSACYITAGRGGTTDPDELVAALECGAIACAGLDVTDPEPLPQSSPLWNMENVLITPHMSGLTDQYFLRAFDIFLENLTAYMATGVPARNIVNYDLQY